MLTASKVDPIETLAELNANGHVVIPNLVDKAMVTDLRDRVERILAHEREHPADPGMSTVEVDQAEAILAICPVLAQCAEHDLPQFVVDSGWQLAPIITAFQHDIGASGRLPPMFMRKVMAASDLNLRP